MDQALFERWKSGDPTAATAMRNQVRTVAVRILSHPAWRGGEHPGRHSPLRDEQARRELTAEVAAEVLQRGGDTPQQLHANAVLVSARRGLEVVRDGRPVSPGVAHAPASLAVLMAVARDALPKPSLVAAERHLEDCGQCRNDVHLVETVVRAQGAVDPDAELEQLAQDAARVEERFPESPAPAARPKPARGRGAVRSARRAPLEEVPSSPWMPVVVVALVGVIGLLAWRSMARVPSSEEAAALVALADTSAPPIPPAGTLPTEVDSALADLDGGDCYTAAKRLRTARKRNPELPELALLEAACFVCAGQAEAAAESFAALDAMPGEPPVEAAWYRAQLALLQGDGLRAADLLSEAIQQDRAHRVQALPQLEAVRELVY